MQNITSSSSRKDIQTVVDSPKVAIFFFLMVIIIGCCFLLAKYSNNNDLFDIGEFFKFILYVSPLLALLLIRFIVNFKGYVIDAENDLLIFPGGGIEADSFLTYFNPMHWLQGFMRHNIQLSEINQIQTRQHTRKVKTYQDARTDGIKGNHSDLRTGEKTSHYLELDGDFGAIKFTFSSRGKMNQLYSKIIQLNEMGTPVLNR